MLVAVRGIRVRTRFTPDVEQIRLLDDLLDVLGPSDSALRASTLGWRAVPVQNMVALPSQEDVRMADDAVAMARRTGQADALISTLHSRLLHRDARSGCGGDAERCTGGRRRGASSTSDRGSGPRLRDAHAHLGVDAARATRRRRATARDPRVRSGAERAPHVDPQRAAVPLGARHRERAVRRGEGGGGGGGPAGRSSHHDRRAQLRGPDRQRPHGAGSTRRGHRRPRRDSTAWTSSSPGIGRCGLAPSPTTVDSTKPCSSSTGSAERPRPATWSG